MNDNLPFRKACLSAKLLSGSAKEKKINPKQLATLFASEKVAGHLPVDETATQAAVAELLAEGIIEAVAGPRFFQSYSGRADGAPFFPRDYRRDLFLARMEPGFDRITWYIYKGLHAYLKEKDVPHVWNVDSNAHDPTEWRNNLYHFVQRIFH